MTGSNFLCTSRNGIKSEFPVWRDFPDLLLKPLREPNIAIRTGGDPKGKLKSLPNSVMTPCGVIRPILPTPSTNQRFPSAPRVISLGNEFGVGTGKLIRARVDKSSRQTLLPMRSVNQMLP